MIGYWDHLRYKAAYDAACAVADDNWNNSNYPDGVRRLLLLMQLRFYPDKMIPDINSLSFRSEYLHDPEDDRYPHTLFLLGIRGFHGWSILEEWEHLVSLLSECWFRISDDDVQYDAENHILTLYTSGWSGNEDIIDALQHMLYPYCPSALTRDPECSGKYVFRFQKIRFQKLRVKNPI